jgi:hypothetical protein
MNPYVAEELGRQRRGDLDREAERLRIVAVARAGAEPAPVQRSWRSILAWIDRRRGGLAIGQPTESLTRGDVVSLIDELRNTRQRLADLERALVARSQR